MSILIANIISLIASVLTIPAGLFKKKKSIIFIQIIQIGLYALSNLVIGSITGFIVNILGCYRNILTYKNKLTKKAITIIIVITTILSLIFNNLSIIGLLPLVSSIIYILYIKTKDIIKLKYVIIITLILWLIHDVYVKAYVTAIFDFIGIISNLISIIKIQSKKRVKQ